MGNDFPAIPFPICIVPDGKILQNKKYKDFEFE
jgi:hypothetical protein